MIREFFYMIILVIQSWFNPVHIKMPEHADAPPSQAQVQECAVQRDRDASPVKDIELDRKKAIWWLNWFRESRDVKRVRMDYDLNKKAQEIAEQVRNCPADALKSWGDKIIIRVGDRSQTTFVKAVISRHEQLILSKDVKAVGAALVVDSNSYWGTHWVVVFE